MLVEKEVLLTPAPHLPLPCSSLSSLFKPTAVIFSIGSIFSSSLSQASSNQEQNPRNSLSRHARSHKRSSTSLSHVSSADSPASFAVYEQTTAYFNLAGFTLLPLRLLRVIKVMTGLQHFASVKAVLITLGDGAGQVTAYTHAPTTTVRAHTHIHAEVGGCVRCAGEGSVRTQMC